MSKLLPVLTLILLGVAAPVAAAESPCRGEGPAAGQQVRGPVLHVLDGRTLCIATGADPATWVQVALEDAPATASWGGLMAVAFGKDVVCTGEGAGRAAICRIEGRSLGLRLSDAGVEKTGLAWKAPADDGAGPALQARSMRVADARP